LRKAIGERQRANSYTLAAATVRWRSLPKGTRVSTLLHVSNLPISATEEALAGRFGQFGIVISTRINRDPTTGLSRRSGFVEMKTAAEAQTAINGLNFADYDGRPISVYRAMGRVPVHN